MAHILVVDSDPLMRNVARELFTKDDHSVTCVDTSQEAIAGIRDQRPDVILLDMHSNTADGTDQNLEKTLREDTALRNIPILLITGVYRDIDNQLGSGLSGGRDFLTKPFDTRELRARTYALLKLTSSVETLMTDLEKNEATPREEYWRMSITDPLTGAYNKDYFMHRFGIELDRSRRTGEVMGLMAIDIPNINDINLELGSEAGDSILRHLAETIRRRLRYTDILSRYAGNEFMALLFNIQPTVLPRIARGIRQTIGDNTPLWGDGTVDIDAAIGGTVIHPNDPDPSRVLISRTRHALGAARDEASGVVVQTLPGELVREDEDDSAD